MYLMRAQARYLQVEPTTGQLHLKAYVMDLCSILIRAAYIERCGSEAGGIADQVTRGASRFSDNLG